MFLFHRKYHWQEYALWSGCMLSILFFIWSVMFWHWHTSLSVLLVAILFSIILSCYKIIHLIHIKHQFTMVQDTIATLALIYFNIQYYYHKNTENLQLELSDINQKINNAYIKKQCHLNIPTIIKALHIIHTINQTKRSIINDIKNLYSTQDFNLQNAQEIADQVYDLFDKTQQLFDTISITSNPTATRTKKHTMPAKNKKNKKINKTNKL